MKQRDGLPIFSFKNYYGAHVTTVLLNASDSVKYAVKTARTNVIGTKPTTADKAPFIALLENGMTAGALAHLAADSSFNTTNINLVGLAQTGIEYIPVG